MNITIITSESLVDFPPITTLLQILEKQGHTISLILPYEDDDFENYKLKETKMISLGGKKPAWMKQYYSNRWKDSFIFHYDRLLKRIYLRRIPKIHKKILSNSDVVWILHENTMLLGGKRFINRIGNYMYTMYELCLKNGHTSPLYEYAARKAILCVVPEYNRAHIAKAIYDLKVLPSLIPNKPFSHPRTRKMPISDDKVASKIAELERAGKKIIMYMGILSAERPLEPIMDAIEKSNGDYVLAVLGPRSSYLDKLEEKYSGKFQYLGFMKAPAHLEAASHADIAYICYVPQNKSINAVFCAPNKVYEFAGFGIPILSNDVPGLKFLVEYNKMGICVPDMSTESFLAALHRFEKEYSNMELAATKYYDSENLSQMVDHTLKQYLACVESN